MTLFTLLKILHGVAICILLITLVIQTIILFKNKDVDVAHLKSRKMLLIAQHSTFSIFLITGGWLLYLKSFNVQSWFYAKVILFIVLLSSVIKAFKKAENILLVQRRGGIIIAWIAFVAILTLVAIKPNLF